MVSDLLRGREHWVLGNVSATSQQSAAVALSIGGARKTYSHTDPNEDAALYAVGPGGTLIAVTDGHHGALAAERVLENLLEQWAPTWTGKDPPHASNEGWVEAAFDALVTANAAIFEGSSPPDASVGRTTLSLALLRPAEDRLLQSSVGDSHVFVVRDGDVRDHAWAALRRGGACFLGHESETRSSLAPKALVECGSLMGVRAVVLATDGLSERGIGVDDPADAVARVARAAEAETEAVRALALARGVVDEAVEAHRRNRAGDNAACAAVWLQTASL